MGYEDAVARDGGRCRGCGRQYTQIHHIKFRSQGGTEDTDNLVCLCDNCHRRAHNLTDRFLSPALLRAVIRTSGNVDGFRLRLGICYTCTYRDTDPLGRNWCLFWQYEVEPDYGCGQWRRNPTLLYEEWGETL